MSQSPFAALGDKSAPKPVVYPWVRPLLKPGTALGTDAISSLSRAGDEAEARYNAGTVKQEGFQKEQEGILRGLLAKRLSYDPNSALKEVGKTAFSFIDPNVISPLAKFDVNYNRINRMAAGLNPASVDSTAQRLRDARIASGRYYDVARDVYSQLPTLLNQYFAQGMGSDAAAAGYIPEIQSGYRRLDLAPLVPANARASSAMTAADIINALSGSAKAATYGFEQPRNIWDTIGEIDSSLWDRLGEGISMASSVYGGFLGGGAGGGLGGMMGGGGGGSMPGGANSAPIKPSYYPANMYPATPGPAPMIESPPYYPGNQAPKSPYYG